MDDSFSRLLQAARGGRVAASGFLGPEDSSRLAATLRRSEVAVSVGGGYPGARRRVVVAHPTHVPEALPGFAALYLAGRSVADAEALAVRLGIGAEERGDIVEHRDGVTQVTLEPPPVSLLAAEVAAERVPLDRLASGSIRAFQVIVPSLRVDVLGARAMRVSRAFFVKGIASGNVYLNGDRVAKGGGAAAGDEIFADGLGWFRLRSVEGETRRGNLRVALEVERSH